MGMPPCLHQIACVLRVVMIKALFPMNVLSRFLFFLELAQVIPGSSDVTLIYILHQPHARAEHILQGLFTFLQFWYNLNLLSPLSKRYNSTDSTRSYGI